MTTPEHPTDGPRRDPTVPVPADGDATQRAQGAGRAPAAGALPPDATASSGAFADAEDGDDPVGALLAGDDDPELAALLTAVSARLTTPPDELTRRRHLRALRRARPRPLRMVAQRTGVAAVAALIFGGLLAGGGLLPDAAQRSVADAAARVGLELPRPEASVPSPGTRDADTSPATDGTTERPPEDGPGAGSDAAERPQDADISPGAGGGTEVSPDDADAPGVGDLVPDGSEVELPDAAERRIAPILPPVTPDAQRNDPPTAGEGDRPDGTEREHPLGPTPRDGIQGQETPDDHDRGTVDGTPDQGGDDAEPADDDPGSSDGAAATTDDGAGSAEHDPTDGEHDRGLDELTDRE